MTTERVAVVAAALVAGFALVGPILRLAVRAPDQRLVRENFRGARVAAVLGVPLVSAGLLVLGGVAIAAALGVDAARAPRMIAAAAVVSLLLCAAGRYDDLRGDERERGFAGHISAARSGRVTGGLIKMAAGGIAGLAAGMLVAEGLEIVEVAVVVALTANFVNLTDTAPGRAGKTTLLLALPVVILGPGSWMVAAGGLLGALVYCIGPDLRAEAMLGDAGANPLGGVAGLGLAVWLDEPARIGALVVLAAANLASERWSLGRIIERTPGLATLDRWGRK